MPEACTRSYVGHLSVTCISGDCFQGLLDVLLYRFGYLNAAG